MAPTEAPLEPQISAGPDRRGTWFPAPPADPVARYVEDHLWEQPEPAQAWEATPLLGAAYLYREKMSGWAIVAKFFVVKMGQEAQKYAEQELARTLKAGSLGLDRGPTRTLRAYAAWRGVLFLEYVNGLTLQDMIAIRNSRLEEPRRSLACVARLLATLHGHGVQQSTQPDFSSAANYARGLVGDLHDSGVLRHNPIVKDGALRLIDRWAGRSEMAGFVPAFIHGDATTANFSFVGDAEVIGTDWERLHIADPADDVGRLLAEVAHSIVQYGGDLAEAQAMVTYAAETYAKAAGLDGNYDIFLERVRFYRAASTLRIARNSWVPEQDRFALVAEALALLA